MTPAETGEAIDARARVVARARSFLGPDGAPRDQDPTQFFRIFAPMYGPKDIHTKAWCGIFVGSVLVLEGLWPAGAARWVDAHGFVGHAVAAGLMRVVDVGEPGDVVVFNTLWHHAIVERCVGGRVYTIDGNAIGSLGTGKDGGPREGCCAHDGKHGFMPRPIDHSVTFYSIHPLLADAGT